MREGCFIAETPKVVEEFLRSGYIIDQWIATEEYQAPAGLSISPTRVSSQELKSASRLQSPNGTLAVFQIPKIEESNNADFILALDGVRDPGNMGTIIRLADWFAIDAIYLSEDCVEVWNPKVVQSTMGSLARVQPVVSDLVKLAESWKGQGGQVWVADMEGSSLYESSFDSKTMLVMGNEANGPSQAIKELAQALTIPRFNSDGAESLNVAMATAIILSQAKRPS